jgi:hypothetical protein
MYLKAFVKDHILAGKQHFKFQRTIIIFNWENTFDFHFDINLNMSIPFFGENFGDIGARICHLNINFLHLLPFIPYIIIYVILFLLKNSIKFKYRKR